MQAVSTVTKIEFSKVKIGFDCTMVLVSVITCLSFLHNLGSGGREIGKILARQLGFEYYDSELIRLAAEKAGIVRNT